MGVVKCFAPKNYLLQIIEPLFTYFNVFIIASVLQNRCKSHWVLMETDLRDIPELFMILCQGRKVCITYYYEEVQSFNKFSKAYISSSVDNNKWSEREQSLKYNLHFILTNAFGRKCLVQSLFKWTQFFYNRNCSSMNEYVGIMLHVALRSHDLARYQMCFVDSCPVPMQTAPLLYQKSKTL